MNNKFSNLSFSSKRLFSFFFIFLFFLILSFYAFSAEYKVEGFVFDFDDGWNIVKSRDPQSVLKIEKNGSSVEFIKMDDELSDFYLNSRLQEQRNVLINKGIKPSDIKTTSIHFVSKAYYFYYEDRKTNIVSLFTYGGVTYNLFATGLSEESFKKIIFSFRKEGEKIEIKSQKPKPKPVAKKIKKIPEESFVSYVSISDSTASVVSVSTPTNVDVVISSITTDIIEEKTPEISSAQPSQSILKEPVKSDKSDLITSIDLMIKNANKKTIAKRKPLDKYIMLVILVIYVILNIILRWKFSKYSNPKIKPYPKEMPPDFLFPFIITKIESANETMYQIITRTNQFLSAHFNHNYKKYNKWGIYGILIIHILWSLGEFIREGFFAAIILSFPLGNYVLSFVEVPFVVMIIFSLFLKYRENQKVVVSDSQMNTLCEVIKSKNGFVVKDAKGRDVIKVLKAGNYFKRVWNCFNEDDQLILTIKDDLPQIWVWIKLLGNKFMKKRCYYSAYGDNNNRIGFLFLDLNSINGYQVHFDYDYFRLVNSIHLVSIFLYIISVEKEENILFF
ncbi:MAG: hypothetical protein K6357_02865 [Elusimicrobiota bacterium]